MCRAGANFHTRRSGPCLTQGKGVEGGGVKGKSCHWQSTSDTGCLVLPCQARGKRGRQLSSGQLCVPTCQQSPHFPGHSVSPVSQGALGGGDSSQHPTRGPWCCSRGSGRTRAASLLLSWPDPHPLRLGGGRAGKGVSASLEVGVVGK